VNTPHGGVALAAFRLDDPELVESGDPGGMLRQVASSAAQVRTAVRACDETDLSALRPDGRPRAIVVAGAGGSVFAGETLAAICGPRSPMQVIGVSGYQLPGWVGAADLVIAVSRSGETAEVLALAAEAARRGCDLAAVAAPGSPLQQVALAARGTFIPVTAGGEPAPARSMAWALTVPLLVMASRLEIARIDAAAYESAAAAMEDISHQCRPSSESFVNPGKSLALDLVGTLPLIWGGSPLAGVAARRFAAQLAANAKYPSLAGVLPDAGHDQVATFDGPFAPAPEPDFPAAEDFGDDSFGELSADHVGALTETPDDNPLLRLVLLADQAGEQSAVTRSREAAVSLAAARGIEVSEIAMDGTAPLVRLAGAVHLLDYASVYLGIACGIDPLAIAAIKDLRDLTEPPV
jgi:glucose/mannose-6-phosphate isomerase